MPSVAPARIVCVLLFGAAASCRSEAPKADDASPIYGCYVAEGAPSFSLSAAGMRVAGSATATPFRYEFRKVGYGIAVPLEARRANGRLSFGPSEDDYFYRLARLSDPTVIIVAFGSDGLVTNYRRSESARCVS